MKKILTGISVLVIIVIAVYFLMPVKVEIHAGAGGAMNAKAMRRMLFEQDNWTKWWPGNNTDTSGFIYHGIRYKIKDKLISSLVIEITGKEISTTSSLDLIAVQEDSVQVSWDAKIPLKNRLSGMSEAKKIKSDISYLTDHLFNQLKVSENIYGVSIKHASVKDSTLISTYKMLDHYPDNDEVYALIDEIRQYASQQNAMETNSPMLNITMNTTKEYLLRVAIPVNKILPSKGNISYKWMLGGGNILISEVKGGQAKVNNALQAMNDYVSDTRMNAPAIAYFSLVTDRRATPDSSKWITRIYYPVM